MAGEIKGVGRFVVKGVHGDATFTGAVQVLPTSNKLVSAGYRPDFAVSEHRDGKGSVFAATADEPVHRLSIRMHPIAPLLDNTLAGAKSQVTLPDRLGVVTLANMPRGNMNGDWYFVGGSIDLSTDGLVELSMELSRFGTDAEAGFTITGAPANYS